jgi:hypothetical protein
MNATSKMEISCMRIRILLAILFLGGVITSSLRGGILVIGELTHEHILQPGDSATGAIEVMNQGDESEQVRVYQTDYSYKADGSNYYDEPGQAARSNASWIEYSPRQFVVLPGERVIVNYILRIPNEELAGTYWSMMMVEPVHNLEPEDPAGGFQVLTVFRYGVQLIVNVGSSDLVSLLFNNVHLIREEGGLFLQMDIENDGDLLVRPNIWAEMFNSTGEFVGKFETRKGRLMPGTSIRRQVDISTLKVGTYKALIVGDCGGDDIFGMELNFQVDPVEEPESP